MSTREGVLKIKKNAGGWRHYIELPNGEHLDLSCGSSIEIAEHKYRTNGKLDKGPL